MVAFRMDLLFGLWLGTAYYARGFEEQVRRSPVTANHRPSGKERGMAANVPAARQWRMQRLLPYVAPRCSAAP